MKDNSYPLYIAKRRFDALFEAMVVRGRSPDRRKSNPAVRDGCSGS